MIYDSFDNLALGQSQVSHGRTMTETDVVNFCMLTGNWFGLHSDIEFAKQTRFGQRVVQGSLVFSIVNALLPFEQEVVEAFYGVDRLRFHKPTFIGDTLHAHCEIIQLQQRGERAGIATSLVSAINQRDKTVMTCELALLVRTQRVQAQTRAGAII